MKKIPYHQRVAQRSSREGRGAIIFSSWVPEEDRREILRRAILVARGKTGVDDKRLPSGAWSSWSARGPTWRPHTVWITTASGSTMAAYSRPLKRTKHARTR